jgi:hypothetical protein
VSIGASDMLDTLHSPCPVSTAGRSGRFFSLARFRIAGAPFYELRTCYLLPATCYLLPATCYLLPATCYLLLLFADRKQQRSPA